MLASDLSETQGLTYGAHSTGTSSPALLSHGCSEHGSICNSAVVAAARGGCHTTKRRSTNDEEFASDKDDAPVPEPTCRSTVSKQVPRESLSQHIEEEM